MNEVIAMLKSPVFWVMSVIFAGSLGLLINYLSSHLNPAVDSAFTRLVRRIGGMNAKRRENRAFLVKTLAGAPESLRVFRLRYDHEQLVSVETLIFFLGAGLVGALTHILTDGVGIVGAIFLLMLGAYWLYIRFKVNALFFLLKDVGTALADEEIAAGYRTDAKPAQGGSPDVPGR